MHPGDDRIEDRNSSEIGMLGLAVKAYSLLRFLFIDDGYVSRWRLFCT
jgi:hypothetical protein